MYFFVGLVVGIALTIAVVVMICIIVVKKKGRMLFSIKKVSFVKKKLRIIFSR